MRKFKPNLQLSIGLTLYAVTHIVTHYWDIPSIMLYTLVLFAIALEIWGAILITRSPEMKNSKLRQWKLRLIGKETK